MAAADGRMLLLIDENVPVSVGRFLEARGHEVRWVVDLFPAGTPDPIIATLGDQMAAMVVTWDRDFDALVKRIPDGNKARFRSLGRISFKCAEPRGVALLERWIDHIEFHYRATCARGGDSRLIVLVSEGGLRLM